MNVLIPFPLTPTLNTDWLYYAVASTQFKYWGAKIQGLTAPTQIIASTKRT